MMRNSHYTYFWGYTLCLLFFGIFTIKATPTDSLRTLLQTTSDARSRAQYYIHLADLYPDSISYWSSALEEANRCNNEPIRRIALKALISSKNTPTVNEYYFQIAEKIVTGKDKPLFMAYLHTKIRWTRMETEAHINIITQELERLKKQTLGTLTPEKQIEWEFMMAESIDCASVSAGAYTDVAKAIPYVEQAIELLSTYPPEQSYDFKELCYKKLINLYTAIPEYNKKAFSTIDKLINLHEEYINMHPDGFERPFHDMTAFYAYIYALPLYLSNSITQEEATYYYQKLQQLYKHTGKRKDLYYDASSLYFQITGKYQFALAYTDSLIEYRRKYKRTIDLISLYRNKMEIYRSMGDYKKALENQLTADSLHEVTSAANAQDKMVEMQTRFGIDELNLERVTLANRNKQIIIIALILLITGIISWACYQRNLLQKLQRTQQKLMESNKEVIKQSEMAQESEKMKTAFIQSMCHEVRTPLNIINGFTNLLLDPSLDCHSKEGFVPIIRENTERLTTLLNDMLEMSSLVSSNEPFEMEQTSLHDLCKQEINDRIAKQSGAKITYRIEHDDTSGTIMTHATYLLTVIRHLLDNAAKFTEHGSIILSCWQDKERNKQFISVTDTGIGIAPEQQEWVFERFTKIDSFKPGAGIGLYLCRLIINRMEGNIYIDPNYKEGCKIVIELPV